MTNMMNSFVKANVRSAGSARTENGAASYSTTGKAILDQFGKAGTARGRQLSTVWEEQAKLWAEDPESALRFPFYLRMITRKDNLFGGKKTELVQKGQGARDESFKRLLWIAAFHKDEFYRNLWLLPVIGSWKDLWVLMSMANSDEVPSDFSLNEEEFFILIAEGIKDDNHRDLVKKYMPRIRSDKKCTTPWAKETNRLAKAFAKFAGWSYGDYRDFKSNGRAHEFQRLICDGKYAEINWSTIPGKALINLVSGKFLGNHGLSESYISWLEKQPTVKFNGYAFELLRKLNDSHRNIATTVTVNKQFDGLIASASEDCGAISGNVLCALDTSGSMGCSVEGGPNGLTSYDVCVSLGIYFSELNKGAFHNTVAMFDDVSTLMTLSGTFSDKADQIRRANTAWGGTNFQSLIDLIINTRRKHPEIPLEDFPKTLLVVSDMQFNPTTSYRYGYGYSENENTNYEEAMSKLRSCFPEEFVKDFKIIWWYCAGRHTSDFPSTMDDAGTYQFSGFDPAVVTLLLGGEIPSENGEKVAPTMEDIVNKALTQEALLLVK